MSEHSTTSTSGIGPMLKDLVTQTPGMTAAALVSADGLLTAQWGLEADDADKMAAAVSGCASLSKGLFHGEPGGLLQIAVEYDSATVCVMRADNPGSGPYAVGSLLATRTQRNADPATVGYAMAHWIRGLNSHLSTAVRGAEIPAT